jgi:hypothetical protein
MGKKNGQKYAALAVLDQLIGGVGSDNAMCKVHFLVGGNSPVYSRLIKRKDTSDKSNVFYNGGVRIGW